MEPRPLLTPQQIGAFHTTSVFLQPDVQADTFLVAVRQETTDAFQALTRSQERQDVRMVDSLLFIRSKLVLPTLTLHKTVWEWSHSHWSAGHYSIKKTIASIQRYFWWPSLRPYCALWGAACLICLRSKNQPGKPRGLLQPLPTPPLPWHSIAFDFIAALPSAHSFTAIWVVVDLFSKSAHLCHARASLQPPSLPSCSSATSTVYMGFLQS